MAKLELFLVAEGVSVDQTTNSVSAFNVLETLPLKEGKPDVIPRCVAFSLWQMEPSDIGKDFQVMLRIHRPGAELEEFPSNVTASTSRHRVFTRIVGLPLEQAGTLKIRGATQRSPSRRARGGSGRGIAVG